MYGFEAFRFPGQILEIGTNKQAFIFRKKTLNLRPKTGGRRSHPNNIIVKKIEKAICQTLEKSFKSSAR